MVLGPAGRRHPAIECSKPKLAVPLIRLSGLQGSINLLLHRYTIMCDHQDDCLLFIGVHDKANRGVYSLESDV